MYKFQWQRIVIKVESALIAPSKQGCSCHCLLSIAQLMRLRSWQMRHLDFQTEVNSVWVPKLALPLQNYMLTALWGLNH
jgi:hypothetical protein